MGRPQRRRLAVTLRPVPAYPSRMDSGGRAALQEEMTALARGDREAFDPLFRRAWPLVRGFAARTIAPHEADDVAQEAMLRIFFRASEFDPGRDALAWLLGVTAWQVRTHRTRDRRRRETVLDEAAERVDASSSPEREAIARGLSEALDEALGELPRSDAETLLAYARGERPDLPGPTFRKRVERALARLRGLWRYDHEHF
jgi:RNA polymerase sigma factor (sigma-70 family)